MLFNSYVFLFAYLPLALAGFFLVARASPPLAGMWLVAASVIFYSWWNPGLVWLLLASIAFNYGMSELIGGTEHRPRLQTALLASSIAANIGALIYYKYLAALLRFFDEHELLQLDVPNIILPLGISFFTFTQIGYLVDVKQGVAKDRGLLNYVLFVTFFPHLIAGPILHNREIMPQFADGATYRPCTRNLAIGATIFIFGMLKKTVIADPASAVVAQGYNHASEVSFFGAWYAVLGYSLQLYFDFSGYSDMAIGLARMFNIRFPVNFNSPYKASCIIDYWQRWHMTLTRYLTLLLYNPLAMWVTRWRMARGLGASRQSHATLGGFATMIVFPTVVTMGLAGIWHGAGLQFLIFGLLHALYLSVNHAWRLFRPAKRKVGQGGEPSIILIGKILLTYLAVLIASVFFRAPSTSAAVDMLAGMAGGHGAEWPQSVALRDLAWFVVLYFIVWFLPNTQQIMTAYEPALGRALVNPMPLLTWRLTWPWAIACGLGAGLAVMAIGGTTEFLYFQF